MNIAAGGHANIIVQCIRQVNHMLKNISLSNIQMSNREVKAEVTGNLAGVGENIDTSA